MRTQGPRRTTRPTPRPPRARRALATGGLLPVSLALALAVTGCQEPPSEPRATTQRVFDQSDWPLAGPKRQKRRALVATGDWEVSQVVTVPPDATLEWSIGGPAGGPEGASWALEARVMLRSGGTQTLLRSDTVVSPQGEKRYWRDRQLDLSEWAGQEVELVFETRMAKQPVIEEARGQEIGSEPPIEPTESDLSDPLENPAGAMVRTESAEPADPTAYWSSPRFTVTPPEAVRPPSVVLLLIDTLRADRLGCYGNPRPISPAIDAMAAGGTLFENAFSQANWTLPSTASLLTGLYPSRHGVWRHESRLARQDDHLPSLMARNGYRTVAFHDGGYLDESFGLGGGFDEYRRWRGFRELPEVVEWIEGAPDVPYFLMLHTYDVHAPYGSVPEFYWRTFLGDEEIDETFLDIKPVQMQQQNPGREFSEAELRLMLDLYDGEIRFVDERLGWFFEELDRLGVRDDLVFVLVSDHGEEFGEHGGIEHRTANLHREAVHVPLILSGPGIPAGLRVPEVVQTVDLLPALADLLGLEGLDRSRLDGQSLVPLLADGIVGEDDRALAQHKNLWVIRSDEWTVMGGRNAQTRVYDRRSDPDEMRDLAAEQKGRIRDETRRMRQLTQGERGVALAEDAEIDEALREELEALGYVD